jgi:hypothetical protein
MMMGAGEGERFAACIHYGPAGADARDSAVSIREENGICGADNGVALGSPDDLCCPGASTRGTHRIGQDGRSDVADRRAVPKEAVVADGQVAQAN